MLNRFLVLTLFLCPLAAYAQSEVGGATLNGTVTDPSAAIISGASVKLSSAQTGFTRTTSTNETGVYSFVRVPVGVYTISIDHAGFRSTRADNVRLDVGAVVTLDFQLSVGAETQVFEVRADVPIVETERTQTSTTVNQRSIDGLPVNGRNFINFVTLTPGVVTDPTRGGDLSFGGQRGPANSLLVDGGSSDNLFYGQAVGRTGFRPYSFSEDAVQEFQVNANSYPAEIGRAGGGVINVITKSGTNQIHGSAFEFYRDRALNANTFTNNRGNTDLGVANSSIPRQPYHFNQFGGSLGAPILKDRLFVFLNYDGQRNTAPQLITPNIPVPAQYLPLLGKYLTPYTTGANNDVGLVKVDWNINDSQRLSARYNINRFTGVNFEAFSGTSALEHTGDSKVSTDNVAVNYSKTFGTNKVLDLRYAYVRDDEPGFANSSAPETSITSGVTFGRNNFSPRYANDKTHNVVGDLSIVRGRHTIKFGADVIVEKIVNYFPGYFSGSYSFPSYSAFAAGTPASFTQAFAGPGTTGATTHPNVNEYAFFAQDAWRVTNRLTLYYGIRYDLFDSAQGSVRNPDPGLLALGYQTDVIPVDHNNVAPRFGFAYKPTDTDRFVVRGGYGIFYARTPAILTNTALAQNGIQVRTYTIFPTNPIFPTYPSVLATAPSAGAPPSIDVMQPDFTSPLTQQYSLNVETALSRDLSLTVGYLGVHGMHLTRTRDINLFPEVPVTGTLPDGSSIVYYRHPGATSPARPNPNFGRISLFDSGADSDYNGLFIQLNKRFARRFQFQASYTWSHVIDSAPDQTAVVVGADDSKMTQDTLNPNADRGNGNADIRDRFVFSGVWDINYANSLSNRFARYLFGGWQLSGIAQVQSGRHFSQGISNSGVTDLNNDGNSASDRVPGVGRNTLTGPNFASVDVRVSRDIPLYGERIRLRFIGEAFNLTNRANFNGLQTARYGLNSNTGAFTNRTDYLRPTSTFDPRILQLAAKIVF